MKLEKVGIIDKDLKEWKKVFLKEKRLTSSKLTIENYDKRLEKFIKFTYLESIENKISLKDIDRYFILGFIGYLKEENKNISDFTIKTYLDTLKSFFSYISDNNDENYNFSHIFKKINFRVEHKIKTSFTIDEVKKIENALKENLNKDLIFSKYRNYLMLYFLLKTGMRSFEVINLKNEDIVLEDNFYKIKIKGKGNKERINFIKADEINPYIEKYLTKKIESEYFFPSKNKKPISRFTLYKFNQRFLKKLGINKTGLHIYRHTFARLMVAKKENLATISEWLGHFDIMITHKYYARSNEENLKNMIT
jgi:integrase/recombinase XerD